MKKRALLILIIPLALLFLVSLGIAIMAEIDLMHEGSKPQITLITQI